MGGSFCKDIGRERSGIIKVVEGSDVKLIEVTEPEVCHYEFVISNPEYRNAVEDEEQPPGEPVISSSAKENIFKEKNKSSKLKKKTSQSISSSSTRISDEGSQHQRLNEKKSEVIAGDRCPQGFYKTHKGECAKRLRHKYSAEIHSKKKDGNDNK